MFQYFSNQNNFDFGSFNLLYGSTASGHPAGLDLTAEMPIVEFCVCASCCGPQKELVVDTGSWSGPNIDGGASPFSGILPDGETDIFFTTIPADIPADSSTMAVLPIGGNVSESLEAIGDRDWFRVDLVAGTSYIFTMDGYGTSPLEDPLLFLLTSDGLVLDSDNNRGPDLNSEIRYTAATSGTFFISAQSFNDEYAGDYRLTASTYTPVPLPMGTPQEIAEYLMNQDNGGVGPVWGSTNISFNIESISAGAQNLAQLAFDAWASVSGLTFTRTTGGADIIFQDTDNGAYESPSIVGNTITGSVINISSGWEGGNTDFDSYTYQTYLHEIGHALGLGHGGPYGSDADWSQDDTGDNIYQNDSWAYTVMSYFDQNEAGGFGSARFVLGPQISDIISISTMYGANTTTRNGDTVYGFNSTETDVHDFTQFTAPPSLSIFDTGGTDLLDFSDYTQDQTISLVQETFSSVGGYTNVISIASGTVIENAFGGSGNDIITGNDQANVLVGNDGHDRLNGGDGWDYLHGGDGEDTLNGGDGLDYLFGDDGADTLNGGDGHDRLIGDDGTDTLNGGDGDDSLAGVRGADTLNGGDGEDYLNGGVGDDTLNGGDDDDYLYGDDDDDTLNGGDGEDYLNGGGGADIYAFDAAHGTDHVLHFDQGSDKIRFEAGSGVTSFSDLTITQSGSHVDIVTSAGTIKVEGQTASDFTADDFEFVVYGTSLGDTITGSAGNDFLYGRDGNDTLNGGDGWDYLYGGDGDDTLNGGDGRDSLYGGDDDDTLNGGDGEDFLYGDDDDDTLNGGADDDWLKGGDGDDTLIGGGGADIYAFDAAHGADHVFHFDQGSDKIRFEAGSGVTSFSDLTITQSGSDVDIVTSAGTIKAGNQTASDFTADDFEFVVYGTSLGDTITGSAGKDFLYGRDGNDILNGGDGDDMLSGGADDDWLNGGAGDDRLYGGIGGADIYAFDAAHGTDHVYNFDQWSDKIRFEAGSGVTSFSDLTITQSGSDVDIVTSAGTIKASYQTASDFTADDFEFVVYGTSLGDTITGSAGKDFLYGRDGNDILNGGDGDDMLSGGADDDWLNGGDGDDMLSGGGGADIYAFDAAHGADHVYGFDHGSDKIRFEAGSGVTSFSDLTITQSGSDVDIVTSAGTIKAGNQTASDFTADDFEFVVYGTSLGDTITGSADNDFLYGHDGDDTLNGGDGDDTLNGGDDNDYLYGEDDNDVLHGGDGRDDLYGGDGDDTLNGGDDNDWLGGGDGEDYLNGGDGDDYLLGDNEGDDGSADIYAFDAAHGTDHVYGFDQGSDKIRFEAGSGVTSFSDLTITQSGSYVDIVTSAGTIKVGYRTASDFTADDFEFVVYGTSLGDTITGSADNDFLYGRDGDDTLDGGDGRDYLYGEDGEDTLNGGDDRDYLYGGDDDDTLNGGDGRDYLYGDDGEDTLNGGDGRDYLLGGDGDDTLNGGDDGDILFGSVGADRLNGGDGIDRVVYISTTTAVVVNLATGGTAGDAAGDTYISMEQVYGTSLGDTITGSAGNDFLYGHDGDDTLNGGDGDDTLYGGDSRDYLYGGDDEDTLYGGDGNDWLNGNDGDDTLNGGDGWDYLYGEDGDDTLNGGDDEDWLSGGDGEDMLDGGDDDDTLIGGDDDDTLIGGDGEDSLNGDDGDDTLDGGDGRDYLFGGDGRDHLYGGDGNDTLNGEDDDDYFYGDEGADTFDGGDGIDRVIYNSTTTAVMVNLATGGTAGDAAGDTYISMERVYGTSLGDTITGSAGNDFLYGRDGNDTLNGGDGDDTLNGGDGRDYLYGGDDDDTLYGGDGRDFMFGDDGDDTLNGGDDDDYLFGGDDDDTLNGGDGDDTLIGGGGADIYAFDAAHGADDVFHFDQGSDKIRFEAGSGVTSFSDLTITQSGSDVYIVTSAGTIKARNQTASDFTADDFEFVVYGTSLGDTITGSAGKDFLYGRDGDDTLNGGDGEDYLYGGDDDDTLYGGDGEDYLYGGDDDDKLYGGDGNDQLYGGDGRDHLYGGDGADILNGGDGDDRVIYNSTTTAVMVNLATGGTAGDAAGDTYISIERVFGTSLGDTITGSAGNEFLYGYDGNDILIGGDGEDYLFGDDGEDYLYGGDGEDWLIGSADDDTLNGGDGDDYLYGGIGGADIYAFDAAHGADHVYGFDQGSDKIRFEAGSGVTSFSDLTITQSGSDVDIVTSAGTIKAVNQTASDFTADDFEFVTAAAAEIADKTDGASMHAFAEDLTSKDQFAGLENLEGVTDEPSHGNMNARGEELELALAGQNATYENLSATTNTNPAQPDFVQLASELAADQGFDLEHWGREDHFIDSWLL